MNALTGYSFRIFRLLPLLAGLGWSQSRPAGCPATEAVFPFVCVIPLPSDSRTFPLDQTLPRTRSTIGPYWFSVPFLVAHWGYINTCSGPVTIPTGNTNFFFPGQESIGQPTVFEPGTHYRAFVSLFQVTVFQPERSGFLDGNPTTNNNLATATNANVMYCQNPTSLISKGAWGATTLYFANDVVTYNGSRWLAKKPEYLVDSSVSFIPPAAANLGVTPVEGDFWTMLAAQGPQGVPGLQGVQGIQGPRGPAGPPGPAGPTAISTVTVPSNTSTATASCGAKLLVSGGGTCNGPAPNSITGRLASSGPSANNGWTVSCSMGEATAIALCAAQ